MANELRQLVDTANAPIFGIDLNGLVNEWNFKTAEITVRYGESVISQILFNDHLISWHTFLYQPGIFKR